MVRLSVRLQDSPRCCLDLSVGVFFVFLKGYTVLTGGRVTVFSDVLLPVVIFPENKQSGLFPGDISESFQCAGFSMGVLSSVWRHMKTWFIFSFIWGYQFVVSSLLLVILMMLAYIFIWPFNRLLYRRITLTLAYMSWCRKYRQTSNMRCTLVSNKIVDLSDVVGALLVGHLHSGLNTWLQWIGQKHYKTRCGTFYKFWDLVPLIPEVWQ